MISMEHFATLIQLITAINCAFIVISFLDRVYSMFFNEDLMVKTYFDPVLRSIELNQGSLGNLKPDDKPEWAVFKKKVLQLQQQLSIYKEQLSALQTGIQCEAQSIRQVVGFKSLFLFISIYCFLDLFLIGLSARFMPIATFIQIAFNLISTFCCVYFYNVIQGKKWEGRNTIDCYNYSLWLFVFAVLISFLCGVLATLFAITVDDIPSGLLLLSNILCIVLPFFPIVFSFYYFEEAKDRLYGLAEQRAKPIVVSVEKIENAKKELERTYYTMTEDNEITWGGASQQ